MIGVQCFTFLLQLCPSKGLRHEMNICFQGLNRKITSAFCMSANGFKFCDALLRRKLKLMFLPAFENTY